MPPKAKKRIKKEVKDVKDVGNKSAKQRKSLVTPPVMDTSLDIIKYNIHNDIINTNVDITDNFNNNNKNITNISQNNTTSKVPMSFTERERINKLQAPMVRHVEINFYIRRSSSSMWRLRVADYCIGIFSLLGIIFNILQEELTYVIPLDITSPTTLYQRNASVLVFQILLTVVAVVSVGVLFFRFDSVLTIKKFKQVDVDHDELVSLGLLPQTIIECVCVCLLPYPGFSLVQVNPFNVSGIGYPATIANLVTPLAFLRVIFCYRALPHLYRYTCYSCLYAHEWWRTKPTLTFATKVALKRHPIQLILLLFVPCYLIIGYSLYVYERNIDTPISPLDSYWLVVATMSLLGYGDIVPKSYGGRAVVIVAAVLGLILMAFIFTAIMQAFEFSDAERCAHTLMSTDRHVTAKRKAAAYLIFCVWKIYTLSKGPRNRRVDRMWTARVERAWVVWRMLIRQQTKLPINSTTTVLNDTVLAVHKYHKDLEVCVCVCVCLCAFCV
eukprot:GHVR01018496.1.p1 GENE.GHVR01018496.1~~GHVR01018496.1.p1  ORF type:complete len:498 (-),score=98.02 GHVR01018496.1:188-1681(-)